MPDWCRNTIVISGDPSELERLVDLIGPEFDFNRIVPVPDELRDTAADQHLEYSAYYGGGDSKFSVAELDRDPMNRERADRDRGLLAKYGAYDWYEWRWLNWHTKWEPDVSWMDNYDDMIEIGFSTAWAFPEPVIRRLVKMFPTLCFRGRAVEHAGGWALRFKAQNGSLTVEAENYRELYAPRDVEDEDDNYDPWPISLRLSHV